MKIIHVNYDASPYGITTFLLDLLEYQKNNYKDMQVAVAFHSDGPCLDRYEKLGIPVYSLGHSSAKDIRSLFGFYKIFKNYDVINLHTHSPWAFLATKMAKKKTVFTFHGALGLKKKWTDIPVKIFYCLMMNPLCDRITFASESSLQRYLKGISCKPKKEKIELFPYGLQIDKIRADHTKKEVRKALGMDGKFIIGTAARMDPAKRLDRLIEAFAHLPQHNDFELVIMGTGDTHYQDYLKNMVENYQLQEQVHFMGYRTDVLDIIASLDLFVLPSCNEPFGLALLEAMALGIPSAVFADGGGAVDIIGGSGFIVRDPQELAEVISTLKEDERLKERVSQNVRLRAEKFDISKTAERLYHIYKAALQKS